MKAWNFKAKSNIQEIVKKLNSAFGLDGRFVFKMGHDKNDSVTFKVRKRILYSSPLIILNNNIIVNGRILKTDTEKETDVRISFTQHILSPSYVFIHFGFALCLIILGIVSSAIVYILIAGILLAIGIVLWFDAQKKTKGNIQQYKTLISEVLEV